MSFKFLSNVFQAACQPVGNSLFAGCIEMSIDVGRCLNVAVSQPLLHIFQVSAVIQQQTCAAMPKLVKTNMRQSIVRKHRFTA